MKNFLIIGATGLMLLAIACDKDPHDNPFDGDIVNQDTVRLEIVNPEPTSFAGIYQNILQPTCANSGCHDGTFEPDYRTLHSAYNTLLYQVPIKNDGLHTYRVEPYKPHTSVLMARLKGLISPSMPIQLEPDSDWPQKKDEYIGHIQSWIQNGAPDIMGNIPTISYPAPVLLGAGASQNGIWLNRTAGSGPLQITTGSTSIRLYFAFRHDLLMPEQLGYNRIAFSPNANVFEGAEEMNLQILASPRHERGFYGDIVAYTHYLDFNPSALPDPGQEQWYFRVYVQDDQNPVTEIPTDNGIYYIKRYMSFRWTL